MKTKLGRPYGFSLPYLAGNGSSVCEEQIKNQLQTFSAKEHANRHVTVCVQAKYDELSPTIPMQRYH